MSYTSKDNQLHANGNGNGNASKKSEVAVVAVPLPAQGHLNQMLQLSSLISSYGLPVYYVGSPIHNRQAKTRINSLSPDKITNIQFQDIPIPPFPSPSPDPNSTTKFPNQLGPATEATLHIRAPLAAFLKKLFEEFKRVVVVHDHLMSYVVQDFVEIPNAESYVFVCVSAFSALSYYCGMYGLPFPIPHPKELPAYEGWMPDHFKDFFSLNAAPAQLRSGNLYNTSRFIEAPYMAVIDKGELINNRPCWAIGPILPTTSITTSSSSSNDNIIRHECLEWLDKQEPGSVIYVSFGTTVSLSDEQINELAHGLERSRVKFVWVLRDADKGDVFDEEVRRAELPEGFAERVGEEGMVVREWAPQPQILAHPAIGGFMSHCGWNSCIESITMGVAIAGWPMHSDQPRNAALVADILKTGIVVREWKDRMGVVKASTIEESVRRLMASEEGEEIRKTAEELGAKVRRAVEAGGDSRLELDAFIAHITR